MRQYFALAAALALVVSAALASVVQAQAAVPASVQIVGTMAAAGGGPPADGMYALVFSLYADATAIKSVWTESTAVAVQGGAFSHALGSKVPLTPELTASPALWLGVQIGADPELPRKQLLSVAYALRAGVANWVECSACVGIAQLDPKALAGYLKAADLAAYAKSANLANVATTGSYADLAGLPVLAKTGASCGSGLVVKGLKADGSLDCVAAMDASLLPADGLSAISNGQLTDQFIDVVASVTTPVAILDNSPKGIDDAILFPDLGLAQQFTVQIDLQNSDLSTITVVLYDPTETPYVLYDKGVKGTLLKASYPDKDKMVSGDLGAWLGKNPTGKWHLTVIDSGFQNNTDDGMLNTWSLTMQTLSGKKVQANGLLITAGGLQLQNAASHPVVCDGTRFGFLYANTKDKVIYVCNGKDFFPLSLTVPGTQDNPALSCKDIVSKVPGSKDGMYWLDPDGPGTSFTPYQTLCDMTTAGGGWTLVFQRRNGNNNHDSFGSQLNDFIHSKGGSTTKLGYDDSFSIGIDSRPVGVKEWLFIDFDASLATDGDDAFIVGTAGNLFPNTVGQVDIAVDKICNGSATNCDLADAYFRYSGNGYFGSSVCNSAQSAGYGGNYGYCHKGLGAYNSNSLFGNREGYGETKLWDYTQTGYMERVFVR